MKRIIVSAITTLFIFGGSASAEPNYNLTLAGLGPTGLLATVHSGVDAAVSAAFPGSTITYQTSGGGFANAVLVNSKKTPLGFVTEAEYKLALDGHKPFKGKLPHLRTIGYVIGWVPMHLVVTKSFATKYGLKDFSDIAKKKPPIRMALQTKANVVSMISEAMLAEIGVTPKDIKSWGGQVIYIRGSEQGPLMADRRTDMMFNMTPIKGRVARAVQKAREVVMLTVDRGLIDRVAKKMGLPTYTIPASAYKWHVKDLYTTSIGISILAHKDMKDQTAFDLAKALVEKIGKIKAVHPFIRKLTPKYIASNKVGQYHPGAARYYKSAGLMK